MIDRTRKTMCGLYFYRIVSYSLPKLNICLLEWQKSICMTNSTSYKMSATVSEEPELLQLAAQLNTGALAEIYDVYSPGIFRYAMRLLGDMSLAEDCVAETFVRFLKALQERRGPRDYLQAYLYRIAHNWIVDFYRNHEETFKLSEALRSETDVPEDEAAKRIRQRQVRKAIRSLTPDQQEVIALKYLEDWCNEEIAQVLHKPVGAVKSIQHRALKSLHRLLKETS
jgi:RNA polymerase sigma-70 factor (ECF subfamily)